MKKLEWQFSTGITGGIVFSLGIPGKNGMVGKYVMLLIAQIMIILRREPMKIKRQFQRDI